MARTASDAMKLKSPQGRSQYFCAATQLSTEWWSRLVFGTSRDARVAVCSTALRFDAVVRHPIHDPILPMWNVYACPYAHVRLNGKVSVIPRTMKYRFALVLSNKPLFNDPSPQTSTNPKPTCFLAGRNDLYLWCQYVSFCRQSARAAIERGGEHATLALRDQTGVRTRSGGLHVHRCEPHGSHLLGASPSVRESDAHTLAVSELPRQLHVRVDRRRL